MTDFFSNLGSGIRFPDARIGGSNPLPTSLSGPAGINGDPDGRYNFNGNLLDGISPYAGPDGGRMGSDRNYQQVPHRIQHIVPKLYLPKAQFLEGKQTLELSHAVDQGDIAFVIVSERIQHLVTPNAQINGPRLQLPARNAFVNLPTVNYLLAGLQRLDKSHDKRGKERSAWAQLADDLQYNFTNPNRLAELLRLVSTRLLPYGICAGSEHQGGKHETGIAPVQAAANHVTTMTVDGQNRDLVNYWRASNISAGDTLIFRLERVPTKQFTLNHYYKQMAFEDFGTKEVCYQLVPDVFRMSYNPKLNLDQNMPQDALTHANLETSKIVKDDILYDYRLHGYWRIGQMFHHRNKHDMECNNYSDDKVFLRGQLMQVTFAPMWIQLDHRLPLDGKSTARQQHSSTHSNTLTPSTGKRKTDGGGDEGGGKKAFMPAGPSHAGRPVLPPPSLPFVAAAVTQWLHNYQLYPKVDGQNNKFLLKQQRNFDANLLSFGKHMSSAQAPNTVEEVAAWIRNESNFCNDDTNWPVSAIWQDLATQIEGLGSNTANWNALQSPGYSLYQMYAHRIVRKIYNDLRKMYRPRVFDVIKTVFTSHDIPEQGHKPGLWEWAFQISPTLSNVFEHLGDWIRGQLIPLYCNDEDEAGPLWDSKLQTEFGEYGPDAPTTFKNWMDNIAGEIRYNAAYQDNPDRWVHMQMDENNLHQTLIFEANFQPLHNVDILNISMQANDASDSGFDAFEKSNLPVNRAPATKSNTLLSTAAPPLSSLPATSTKTDNMPKPKIIVRKAGDVLASLMPGEGADSGKEGAKEGAKNASGNKKKVLFGKRAEKE